MRAGAWVGVYFLAVVSQLPRFFKGIEARPGVVLVDPVLDWLTPRDLTWLIFVLLYTALLGAVYVSRAQPLRVLKVMFAYATLAIIRMICMSLVALEPPPSMVVLIDPFVDRVLSGGAYLTKDLFFSGHTSTVTLLALGMPKGRFKNYLTVITPVLGVALLIQHVHYTVDVLAAPIAAALAWWISGLVFNWAMLVRD